MADDEDESSSYSGGDSVTEVSEQGFFSRLMNSFASVLFGIAIFFGSFVVLYMNEGSINEAKLAKDAVEVSAEKPSSGAIGKFVAATGALQTDDKLGDAYLKKAKYVALHRSAQMYAWVESKSEKKEDKVGGGQKTTTTYSYAKQWTASPENSSSFKKSSGHKNPSMSISSEDWKADKATLDTLDFDIKAVTMPSGSDVKLTDGNTKGGDASGGYLYLDDASPSSPDVGDIRLSYTAVEAGGKYTLLGKLASASSVEPYQMDKTSFYRIFTGTKADALKTLQFEYSLWIWAFRVIGFLMMWGGMRMMMEPLNTVLGILPFMGSLGRGMTGFLTFPIAVVLSCVTIVVAWITHSLIAMVLIGLLTVAGGVMLFGKKKAAA